MLYIEGAGAVGGGGSCVSEKERSGAEEEGRVGCSLAISWGLMSDRV